MGDKEGSKCTLKVVFPEKLVEGQNVARFFYRFEACVELLNLKTDEQKKAQLTLLLGDSLFDYVPNLPKKSIATYEELKEKISKKLRLKILDTIYESGKGHIGGAYSCVDILSVLYFGNILNINKNNYKDLNRNKFILSKGHAAIAQYVVLEKLGLITNDDLNRLNNGGILG